jgi:hypothetical protein
MISLSAPDWRFLLQIAIQDAKSQQVVWSVLLEVANTVLWLMPKYSIAMHGSAWHCSTAKDAGYKDLCSNVPML